MRLFACIAWSCGAFPLAAATEISCADNAEVRTRFGTLTNNAWNRQAAGDRPVRQCILERGVGAQKEYGWSWSWPRIRAPFAYPEMVMGGKPGRGGEPFSASLP